MSAPGVRVTIGGAAGVHVSLCGVSTREKGRHMLAFILYLYQHPHGSDSEVLQL